MQSQWKRIVSILVAGFAFDLLVGHYAVTHVVAQQPVQPANIANTTPWLFQNVPGTANGLTTYNLQPAASDNHANIKNGAGQVYHISATNNSGTVNYLRLYNAATGFNGCNSATNLQWETIIPANTSGAGYIEDISQGVAFGAGISICVTGAYGNTDTTNATATAIEINVGYK